MLKPILFIAALAIDLPCFAADPAPTGGAKVLDIHYSGQKAVYDAAVDSERHVQRHGPRRIP